MPIEVINTASLINGSFTRRNFAITSNGTHRLTGTTLLNSNGFTYQQNTLGDRLIATSPGGAGEYIANCYMNIPLRVNPCLIILFTCACTKMKRFLWKLRQT